MAKELHADLGWVDGSGQVFSLDSSDYSGGVGSWSSGSSVNMGLGGRGVRFVAYTGSSVGSATSVLRCMSDQSGYPPLVVMVSGVAGAGAGSSLEVVFRSPLFLVLGSSFELGTSSGFSGSYYELGGDGWVVDGWSVAGDSCCFVVRATGVNSGLGQGNSGWLRLVLRPAGCSAGYVGLSGVARFTQEGSEFSGFTQPRYGVATLLGGSSGGLVFDLRDDGYSGVCFRGLEVGALSSGMSMSDALWGPMWGGLDIFEGLLDSVSVSGVDVVYGGDTSSWVSVDSGSVRLYLDGGEVCCSVGLGVGYGGSVESFVGGVVDVRVSFEGVVQGVSGVSLGGVVCSLVLGSNAVREESLWMVNGVSAGGSMSLGYLVRSMSTQSLGGVGSSGELSLEARRSIRRVYATGGEVSGGYDVVSGVGYSILGVASGLLSVSGSVLRRGSDRYAGDVYVAGGLELRDGVGSDAAVVGTFDVVVGGDGLSGGYQTGRAEYMWLYFAGGADVTEGMDVRLSLTGSSLVLPGVGRFVRCDGRVSMNGSWGMRIWMLERNLYGYLDLVSGAVYMDGGGVLMPRSFTGGGGELLLRGGGREYRCGVGELFGTVGGGVSPWVNENAYITIG